MLDFDDTDLDSNVDPDVDIDVDPEDINEDDLNIPDDDIDGLKEKADGVERSDGEEISFKGKICATRHGCQGATNCDYAYGNYPG